MPNISKYIQTQTLDTKCEGAVDTLGKLNSAYSHNDNDVLVKVLEVYGASLRYYTANLRPRIIFDATTPYLEAIPEKGTCTPRSRASSTSLTFPMMLTPLL